MTTPRTQRLDVFPAKVSVGENHWDKARVRTDGDQIEVWVETPKYPHDPIRVFLEQVDEITSSTVSSKYPVNQQRAEIQTPAGTLNVQRQGGCGCGSKLRTIPQTRTQMLQQKGTIEGAIASHFPAARI